MENKIVCKSNVLIEASYRLTAQEQWIILFLTSLIKNNDEDFKEYSISVKDFSTLAGISHKGEYQEIKEITRKLIGRVFTINEPPGPLQVSWLSSARYIDGKGTVTLRFDPGLKPYLLQLKNRFTKYNLPIVMSLKSSFSIRIYELLKQYERIGHRDFSLPELRERLGIEMSEYPFYGNFKAKIILVAQRELKAKTDISFEFEEIKVGRSVGKIRFYIKSKTASQIGFDQAEEVQVIPLEDQDFAKLVSLLPVDYQQKESIRRILKHWLEKKRFDYVARNIEYANVGSNAVNPNAGSKKGSNYRVYLEKSLKGDFGLARKEDNQAREVVEEKLRQEREAQAKKQKLQEDLDRIERENQDRARVFQENLSSEALITLREEAFSRLTPSQQELVQRKSPGTERLLKITMTKICLERMNLSPGNEPKSEEIWESSLETGQ